MLSHAGFPRLALVSCRPYLFQVEIGMTEVRNSLITDRDVMAQDKGMTIFYQRRP